MKFLKLKSRVLLNSALRYSHEYLSQKLTNVCGENRGLRIL